MKPKLYILAGANGSGKSTISKVLLPAEGIVSVNPDDIAGSLIRKILLPYRFRQERKR